MSIRRNKLAEWIAMQTAAATPKDRNDIAEMRVYPVREPASGRGYTIVRLRTQSGLVGWGEAGRVSAADAEKARSRIVGRPATAHAVRKLRQASGQAKRRIGKRARDQIDGVAHRAAAGCHGAGDAGRRPQ